MALETRTVLGLDVGTSRIVLASQSNGAFQYESMLNAFVKVPYSKMTENSLRRVGVSFTTRGEELMVLGDEAPQFADLLGAETARPMTLGVLNPGEVEAVPVVRSIIESMVPVGERKPKLYFSVPAAPLNGEEALTYHEATLRQMFGELGWECRGINEGLAVVYSELEDTNYTGIGVSFGGGLCNVALAYLSMPAISFSIPKGGDFIDASAAAVTGDLANRIRITKEQDFHFNGHYVDQLHQVLTVYYDDVIQAVIAGMKDAFTRTKLPKLTKAVPMVLSGGTACPPGFRDRFEKALKSTDFPVVVSEVRMAKDPLHTTAKGALIAALTEM